MTRNKKPFYIIILFVFAMYVLVWWLKMDKPVEVAAEQANRIETYEDCVQLEVAPVQPDLEIPDVPEMTPEEIEEEMYWDSLELLAICAEAEAGNQGLEGKRLVIDVVLNRVDDKSGIWPDTIEGVITQSWQFTSYWDGGMDRVTEISEETYEAVRLELEERSYPGIYYFREGDWPEYGTPWKKVGDHYFSGK